LQVGALGGALGDKEERMRFRLPAAAALAAGLLIAVAGSTVSLGAEDVSKDRGDAPGLSPDFKPAAVRAQQDLGRYFVVSEGPSVAQAAKAADDLSAAAQREVAARWAGGSCTATTR
jgi:hypothetical protein